MGARSALSAIYGHLAEANAVSVFLLVTIWWGFSAETTVPALAASLVATTTHLKLLGHKPATHRSDHCFPAGSTIMASRNVSLESQTNLLMDGRLARCLAASAALAGLLAASPALAAPASSEAGLSVCNDSDHPASVALGYKGDEGWQSKGWATVRSKGCELVHPQDLSSQRYYYLFAIEDSGMMAWQGEIIFCTRDGDDFTVEGQNDCVVRGYERNGFFELDTGGASSWVVHLGASDNQRPTEIAANTSYHEPASPKEAGRYQQTEVLVTVGTILELKALLAEHGLSAGEALNAAEMLAAVRGSSTLEPGARVHIMGRAVSDGSLLEPYRISIYDSVDGRLRYAATVVLGERGIYLLATAPPVSASAPSGGIPREDAIAEQAAPCWRPASLDGVRSRVLLVVQLDARGGVDDVLVSEFEPQATRAS